MITVTPVDPAGVAAICANLREADRIELSALGGDPESWAAEFGDEGSGWALTRMIWRDGAPVAVLSLEEFLPGVCWAAAVATDAFPRVAWTATREARAMIAQAFAGGARRIETRAWADHPGHGWLGLIGLEDEVRLPGFGLNGEDFIQCAKRSSRASATSSRG